MIDTSIGQRIAERRKLLNLSHEALDDKGDVTLVKGLKRF